MTSTYFALSDIHGRPVSIQDFEKKGFDLDNPDHTIVLVGDYFDRGNNNLMVLEFIEKYKTLLKDRFILLKGNHDEFIIKFINYLEEHTKEGDIIQTDPKAMDHWSRNGGEITLEQLFGEPSGEYTLDKQNNVKRLKSFLSLLQDYYETKDYIFTHAAINEERIIDTWDREFMHVGLPSVDKTIIIGHTSHPYLDERMEISEFGQGIIAKSKSARVIDIDGGQGNNIVVFTEKKDSL